MIWQRRNQADTWRIARIVFSAGLLCALVQPTAAMAGETESFTCTLSDQVRRIERVFEPGGAPCTVQYYRNNQPPQTLWRARESGSVCVDGVSLTVNAVDGASFEVNLIPHTLEVTILRDYRPGARVNLEIDIIARYVERMFTASQEMPPPR